MQALMEPHDALAMDQKELTSQIKLIKRMQVLINMVVKLKWPHKTMSFQV